MEETLKTKWLNALRSGEYRQGKFKLRNKDSDRFCYCCLGLLCEVVGTGQWSSEAPNVLQHYETGKDGDFQYVPNSIREAVGLSKDDIGTLINMNDHLGKTFPEIADFVEAKR